MQEQPKNVSDDAVKQVQELMKAMSAEQLAALLKQIQGQATAAAPPPPAATRPRRGAASRPTPSAMPPADFRM